MPLLVFLLQLAFPQLIEPNTIVLPSRDWAPVVTKVAPSIVPVQADMIEGEPVPIGTPGSIRGVVCTAVVIDRNECLLLTERHCIMDMEHEVEVLFDGVPEIARFYAPDNELALVKTKGRNSGWKTIDLRKDPAWDGMDVAVYGYGLQLANPTFSSGTVVGRMGRHLITTLVFSRGHSGSPVFDRDGRLITIARAVYKPYFDMPTYYGIGAVPSDLPEFIARGVAAFKKMKKTK